MTRRTSTSCWPTSQTLVIPICFTLTGTATAAAAVSAAFTINIPADVPQQLPLLLFLVAAVLRVLLWPTTVHCKAFLMHTCGFNPPRNSIFNSVYVFSHSLPVHTSLELYYFAALSTDAATAAVHPSCSFMTRCLRTISHHPPKRRHSLCPWNKLCTIRSTASAENLKINRDK